MNIYHLKYFIDAARLQSISRSADENRVSHSAVSQAIKNLEAYFGVELMYHSKRKFELTPSGESCLLQGQQLLQQLLLMRENLQFSQKEARGDLIIWAPQSLIVDSLYRALSIYRKKHPKVQIQLRTGAAAQVKTAIANGEGHVGIAIEDGHIQNFESVKIKSGQFVLVARSADQSLKDASVLITSKDKIEVQHLRKNYKSRFKSELKVGMEVMSWGVIRNLVKKNFGVGYVPDYCVTQELDAGTLHKLSTPGTSFQYDIRAIWPSQKHIHPNAEPFLELLKEQLKVQ